MENIDTARPSDCTSPLDSTSPLQGIRVVSLATNLPGPLAAARLASLGADVTKIEPVGGDPLSAYAPEWYQKLSSGQRVIQLDLKDPAGFSSFENELSQADLLITSMRPSAADRLGVVKAVAKFNVAHVEIVGDEDNPESAGHDLTYQAQAGTLSPPAMPTTLLADVLGGERAATAALAMLWARAQGSHGTPWHRRVGLAESAKWASSCAELTAHGKILSGALPGYRLYEASDGWVALAALEPHFMQRAAEYLGATHEAIAARIRENPASYWQKFCAERDIPLEIVRTNP